MMSGDEIVRRARELLGVRFRPQGRSPEHGLDCVGLAAWVYGIEGARSDYGLRFGDNLAAARGLAGLGFGQVDPESVRPGDLLLVRPGPGQLHIAIATGAGFVHSDARLRRVVEVPGRVAWPVLSAWRRRQSGDA